MEALRVEGLSKSFGGLTVLQEISFAVQAGARLAIIGPNGAGKTTLLNVLSGELSSDSGLIYLFGQEITTTPTHRRVHFGLGRSFQISQLFFRLTVLDNVLIALQGTRPSRFQMFKPRTTYDYIIGKAKELLESVDLWENRSSITKFLSHGEQRRLEIAVALASEPKLLLLDEPTAGLSVGEAADFINIIQHMAGGTTVIFCDHDMSTVFRLGDRIMVLYFGKMIAEGTPEEIKANSRVNEIYLGVREGKVDDTTAGIS